MNEEWKPIKGYEDLFKVSNRGEIRSKDGNVSNKRNIAFEFATTEEKEQQTLTEWALYASGQIPELRLFFHIPNGMFRHKSTAAKLKRLGVKPGIPDICLPVPRGKYHGLYIELKRRKGGHVTPEQLEWIDALNRQGYRAVVCKGWHEASETIMTYLNIDKDKGGNIP
jgi:hypothetical protein